MPGIPGFTRNVPGGQPAPGSTPFNRIPSPGGENAQEASSYLGGFYGEMPIPATAYVTSTAALHSRDVIPSVRTVASNASVVDRRPRRNGIDYTAGRQSRKAESPQRYKPIPSSWWQHWLIGPQVNYILNDCWYIAYPAATISFGTMRNLAWSEKVPQLPTRTTGGPGPAAMMPAPRFQSVQNVPRYSTMPSQYPTQSSPG
jgi:hypothetical protein